MSTQVDVGRMSVTDLAGTSRVMLRDVRNATDGVGGYLDELQRRVQHATACLETVRDYLDNEINLIALQPRLTASEARSLVEECLTRIAPGVLL